MHQVVSRRRTTRQRSYALLDHCTHLQLLQVAGQATDFALGLRLQHLQRRVSSCAGGTRPQYHTRTRGPSRAASPAAAPPCPRAHAAAHPPAQQLCSMSAGTYSRRITHRNPTSTNTCDYGVTSDRSFISSSSALVLCLCLSAAVAASRTAFSAASASIASLQGGGYHLTRHKSRLCTLTCTLPHASPAAPAALPVPFHTQLQARATATASRRVDITGTHHTSHITRR
jgi:hypothetical protein